MNSLIIAFTATIVSTILGTLAAYALWKRRSPLFTTSLYLSLLTPEIVTGVSLLAFYEWIFRYLHVQLGMHTVILAHISFSLVYVVLVVLARLRTFDVSLEEAALDLGATEWQVFRHVTVPMLLPGIAAAALLRFTVSFDDYVITSLVAGVNSETLPMVIYGDGAARRQPGSECSVCHDHGRLRDFVFARRSPGTKLRHRGPRRLNRRLFLMGVTGAAVGCTSGRRRRRNVYNWENYVASTTLPTFEREFNCRARPLHIRERRRDACQK